MLPRSPFEIRALYYYCYRYARTSCTVDSACVCVFRDCTSRYRSPRCTYHVAPMTRGWVREADSVCYQSFLPQPFLTRVCAANSPKRRGASHAPCELRTNSNSLQLACKPTYVRRARLKQQQPDSTMVSQDGVIFRIRVSTNSTKHEQARLVHVHNENPHPSATSTSTTPQLPNLIIICPSLLLTAPPLHTPPGSGLGLGLRRHRVNVNVNLGTLLSAHAAGTIAARVRGRG